MVSSGEGFDVDQLPTPTERRILPALFPVAIDSKLSGYDLVALRVADVAPLGCFVDRAVVRQRKTGHPVKFGVSELTREALDTFEVWT